LVSVVGANALKVWLSEEKALELWAEEGQVIMADGDVLPNLLHQGFVPGRSVRVGMHVWCDVVDVTDE